MCVCMLIERLEEFLSPKRVVDPTPPAHLSAIAHWHDFGKHWTEQPKALSTHQISPQTLNMWQSTAILLRWSCRLKYRIKSFLYKIQGFHIMSPLVIFPSMKSRLCRKAISSWAANKTPARRRFWLEKVTRHDKPLCIAMQWFLLALVVPNWITSCETLEDNAEANVVESGKMKLKACQYTFTHLYYLVFISSFLDAHITSLSW